MRMNLACAGEKNRPIATEERGEEQERNKIDLLTCTLQKLAGVTEESFQ